MPAQYLANIKASLPCNLLCCSPDLPLSGADNGLRHEKGVLARHPNIRLVSMLHTLQNAEMVFWPTHNFQYLPWHPTLPQPLALKSDLIMILHQSRFPASKAVHRACAYLNKAGGGVDVDGLGVFDGAVGAVLLQQRRMVEETGSNGLADDIMVPHAAGQLNLHPFHQPQQLLPDIPRPFHAPHLTCIRIA